MTRHAGGRGRSRRRAEDGPRTADMSIHAGFGDPQQIGDLFRRKTARDRAQHLTLPIGQRGERSRAPPESVSGNDVTGEDPDQHGCRALHSRCSDRDLRGG
jgi:hypothetical protein